MIAGLVFYVLIAVFVVTFELAAADHERREIDGMEALAILVRSACWLPMTIAALALVAVDAAAATRRR